MKKKSKEYRIKENFDLKVKVNKNIEKLFNPNMLGIDLTIPTSPFDGVCAIFDLEGFTQFSNSTPHTHIVFPKFINAFLIWIFNKIKKNLKDPKAKIYYWAQLPFYAKFLGDGVLFIWKIDKSAIEKSLNKQNKGNYSLYENLYVCNVITAMFDVCGDYLKFVNDELLKSPDFQYAPKLLRCGIARGQIYPLGGGKDFIGVPINICSRLQKLHGLSFSFSAMGVDNTMFNDFYKKIFVPRKTTIRGFKNKEIVYVIENEFQNLSRLKQNKFKIL